MTDLEIWKATGWAVMWATIVVLPIWGCWKIWAWKGETINFLFHFWIQEMVRRKRHRD